MYNDMYEQKKVAYHLKQEVVRIKEKSGQEKEQREKRRQMLANRMNLSSGTVQKIQEEEAARIGLPAINEKPEVPQQLDNQRSTLKSRSISMPSLPVIGRENIPQQKVLF